MSKFNRFPKFFKGGIGTGTIYLIIALLGIVGFSTMLTDGLVPPNSTTTGTPITPAAVQLASDTDKSKLQLYTFGFMTSTPTNLPTPTLTIPTVTTFPTTTIPTPTLSYCPLDDIKPPGCGACLDLESVACDEVTCEGNAFRLRLPPGNFSGPNYCIYVELLNPALYQQKMQQPNCFGACIAKPVIYLYPTQPTIVNVSLKIPGNIYISDPLYLKEGWKNVLAYPDGSLIYKNKNYHELYYETDVDKVNGPDNGIVIAKKDLGEKLTEATTRLGLRGIEQTEFLEYWLPELHKLDFPYILFSVIDPVEKERIDHVDISPKPDTFIAFIAYFKPLKSKPANLKPLKLPEQPPKRIGFTAVEWGGTIAD